MRKFIGLEITDPRRTLTALLMVAVLSVTMFTTACSTKWIDTAEQYIALAAPAVDTALQLLTLFGGQKIPVSDVVLAHAGVALVTEDLTHLKVVIEDYNAATAAGKPSALAKVQAVINVAQNDLAMILPPLHITDKALQDKIASSLAIVGSLLQEVSVLVATAQAGKTARTAQAAASLGSPKRFKQSFNANLTAATGVVEIDSVTPTLVLR